MLIYHRPVAPKVPKRRSRAGCVHCKEKKKKCNEERPQCDRCQERGLKCEYEPVKPRKRRRTISALEQETRPATSVPGQAKGLFRDRLQALRHDSSSGSSILSGSPTPPLPALADEWSDSGRSVFSPSSVSSCSDPIHDLDATLPLPPLDPLERFANDGLGVKLPSPDHMNHLNHLNGLTGEDFDEEIPTTRDLLAPTPTRTRTSYPDLAIMSHPTHGSPIDYSIPPFMEFSDKPSRRHLMSHFCGVLSQLMVFKEDTGNPFRQLILPMAARSSPVLNAVLAISSAHLEHQGFQTEERALDLHSNTLQGLRRIMAEDRQANKDEVLAVIMLLVYYEELSALSSVDTIFGLVTDLWPIIHRLAYLYQLKQNIEEEARINPDKAAEMRNELETASATLELALRQWTPKVSGSLVSADTPADDSRLQSILNNAEAYKQAAFVFLFRNIHSLPRHSAKVQMHTKQALQACLRVIIFAGPMSALLWPLSMAACEAVEEVDQNTARTVFEHLERRQGMQNIVSSWEVCEEIWRRQLSNEEVNWRDVCAERHIEIVFG
ncbi:MAG: hypothetical protein M1827_003335 [Pycnora praestabilis]|nr:MAG: hypothetical protein M1827_003335 [Pycnora praestabilis]